MICIPRLWISRIEMATLQVKRAFISKFSIWDLAESDVAFGFLTNIGLRLKLFGHSSDRSIKFQG